MVATERWEQNLHKMTSNDPLEKDADTEGNTRKSRRRSVYFVSKFKKLETSLGSYNYAAKDFLLFLYFNQKKLVG